MSETDGPREAWLDGVVRELRTPPERKPGAIDALLEEAFDRRPPGPVRGPRWWRWLRARRVSPLAAAGWAVAAAVATLLLTDLSGPGPAPGPSAEPTPRVHQFVLLAPQARSVSVVGDFNAWQVGATPLRRDGDVWTVEVELAPGRHVYSFVIDREEWVPDADAPRAAGEEFGRPSSVLTLAGTGA